MTEHCSTCKYAAQPWSDRLQCGKIKNGIILSLGGNVEPYAFVHPNMDFGCIYHEAWPILVKPVCDTCAHWDRTTCPSEGFRFRCKVRSTEDFVVMTGGGITCELWSEKHD